MIVPAKTFFHAVLASGVLAIACLALRAPAHAASTSAPPIVVPAVQSWVGGIGRATVRHSQPIVVDAAAKSLLDPVAKDFQEDLRLMGLGDSQIVHSLPSHGPCFFLSIGSLPGIDKSAVRDQAYEVSIANGNVAINAPNAIGAYYGARTILQMLAGAAQTHSLPNGTIVDYPKYRRRMLMLDVGRKPFPYPVLLDYLRMMGWFKFNELHLHLSDESSNYSAFRVQCDTFPGLTAKDCFYTKGQLRELQDIAHVYGITVTPEIDMPGHALAFTSYWPDLRNPKLSPSYLDVTNPQTVVRMEKLLDEMIPLFDAPDFHIGTDEYSVGGAQADRLRFHEAFRQFINTMNAYVRSKGKNCRIWSGYEHMLGDTQIDPTVTVDMWESNDAQAEIAQGHNIINSDQGRTYIVPGAHYYGVSNSSVYNGWEPWMMNDDPSKNPRPDDPHFLGSKLHVWMDQGPTGYDMAEIAALVQPSLMAFGEKMWGSKGFAKYATFAKQTAALQSVPGVTVFDRIPARNSTGMVLAVPQEHELAHGKTVPLAFFGKPRTDLEWPWTLTMQVMKTADTKDRGVILSSPYAEICSDYSQTESLKVKDPVTGVLSTVQTTRRGVGIDRACGQAGTDPSLSNGVRDVSGTYTDPLVIGQWTTISVVGAAGHTSVYVNGILSGQQNNQMLCPLAELGSPSGCSFSGKVKNLTVWDKALSAREIGRLAGLDIPDDLAAGCTVTASASDTPYGFVPENITDGDLASRWSSGITNAPQQVTIDLAAVKAFDSIDITWETAYPGEYDISVSNNLSGWTHVFSGAGKVGLVTAYFPATSARYVKIDMSKPATGWGYSIWDAEVMLRKR